ncbi:MAG: putative baseplate assembly protein, partial [Gemmatimonadota bacterium]
SDVLNHPTLNGIDYLEVDPDDHTRIRVHFLKPVPPADATNPADPDDAYGLSDDPSRATITGGVRIVDITVDHVVRLPDGSLDLTASAGGDYSTYRLDFASSDLDPFLAGIDFSFMASCPVDFDCAPDPYCPPPEFEEPLLDYTAKDYASFRRMMLDLIPHLNPSWTERNPSDLGIVLVELLAHTGDQLSYFQDATANEAFLETVRQRISARRHARLVDYRMHDGRNASTFVHLHVNANATLPQATPFLTRIFAPLAGTTDPPGAVLDRSRVSADALEADPALASVAVFESTHQASFDPRNNEIQLHAFGNEECCLAPGTTEAFLYSVSATGHAEEPVLSVGDYVLLEEVRGPLTGLNADADPERRQVVRIAEAPEATTDPVYGDQLEQEEIDLHGHLIRSWGLRRRQAGDPALPLLRVRWRRQDALEFPLCLSARTPGFDLIRSVSVARGNMVLIDHGLTTSERVSLGTAVPGDAAFRLELSSGPLTQQCQPDEMSYEVSTVGSATTVRPLTPRHDLECSPHHTTPAALVLVTSPGSTTPELWTPVPDLLDSTPFSRHFVAEVDNRGRASLRFGDGEYGREVAGATGFQAVYRIGNGTAGNVGAETVAHVALPGPAAWIDRIRNPLAAEGGTEPETIDRVRRHAPQAFRARQFRAVTEADYARAAEELPDVASAVASFRWTGSWHTVFVGVDPADSADLVRRPRGRTQLSARLKRRARAFLNRYRMAGYDLEIRPPVFVPIELAADLCVQSDHFRADVATAVMEALSNRVLPTGARGFFHSDHFGFGDSVYLSQIYAAIEAVEGVDSAVITLFQRQGEPANGELAAGVMRMGPWEIPILDNDPSFQENGVLTVVARGGKA